MQRTAPAAQLFSALQVVLGQGNQDVQALSPRRKRGPQVVPPANTRYRKGTVWMSGATLVEGMSGPVNSAGR
ncbi:MAG: hypothetical protein NTW28_19715, partial [Candidatus Solibacter sp.]|nr:hypothetical protein [Candidatus Solibacter sp.]